MKKVNFWITIFVFFAAVAPLILPDYYVQLSTRSLILALVSMSFILLGGYSGMTSLAQMSFFATSGYLIGILVKDYNWNFLTAILVAVLGAGIYSAICALIAIRAQGIYFLMLTLAFSQVTYGIAMQWQKVTRGSEGFPGIPRPSIFGYSLVEHVPQYYFTLIFFLVCYFLIKLLINSTFGLSLQGIRDCPTRMSALGFNVQLHRFIIFVISGLIAGIAGVLGVFFYGGVAPTTTSLSQIILYVMASIVGGVSRVEGGILGSFLTVLLWSFASQLTQRYMTVIGLAFVFSILLLPKGLINGAGGFRSVKNFSLSSLRGKSQP